MVALITFLIVSTLLPEREMRMEDADYITAESLEERIATAPIIAVGRVKEVGGIVNMARKADDLTEPDPHIFILGQVYHIEVERYLKGGGATTLQVVQPEGMISDSDRIVTAPTTPEELSRAREGYNYVPIRTQAKYLFFIQPLPELGSEANYVTGSSHPWRFTLPQKGAAHQESPVQGLDEKFPPLLPAALLGQVEQLIHKQK